ncbi:MAG: CBS domain-containing protein [Pseudomonadota bacterium]
MRAAELMTRDVAVVAPDASVREAARMMEQLNVGVLPVCDGRRLVGIVTDRDVTVRAIADGMLPDRTPVHMVMTEDVCWCLADDPVAVVQHEMARRRIRRVPVIDQDRRLIGMISMGDLATRQIPGAGETLRRISEPSEPDRSRTTRDSSFGDAPWPAFGERSGGDVPRG